MVQRWRPDETLQPCNTRRVCNTAGKLSKRAELRRARGNAFRRTTARPAVSRWDRCAMDAICVHRLGGCRRQCSPCRCRVIGNSGHARAARRQLALLFRSAQSTCRPARNRLGQPGPLVPGDRAFIFLDCNTMEQPKGMRWTFHSATIIANTWLTRQRGARSRMRGIHLRSWFGDVVYR
jgi:hypothetical protein